MSAHDSTGATNDALRSDPALGEEHRQLQQLINDAPGIEALIGLHISEMEAGVLLVGAKIAFPPDSSVEHIARSLRAMERDICNAVPRAKAIYLQPDLYVDTPEFAPSTDHIVIPSGN